MIDIEDAVLVWFPKYRINEKPPHLPQIRVTTKEAWSHYRRDDGDYWIPVGSAWNFVQPPRENKWTRLCSMFILFNTVVVRDGVPVEEAHRAFLAIKEYALKISPDIKGAI